jgi:hypothetical protein
MSKKRKEFTNCFGIKMTKEEDNPVDHVSKWYEANKNNYPSLHILREYKFETLFKYWFIIWRSRDVQEYQDMEWDWEVEIEKFLEDPAFQTQHAIKLNPEICVCCGKQKEGFVEALQKDINEERNNNNGVEEKEKDKSGTNGK